MKIASTKIIILFEDEIVLAARSLAKFAPGSKDKPTKDDAEAMLRACFTALYSPELAEGKYPVTIVRSHDITE